MNIVDQAPAFTLDQLREFDMDKLAAIVRGDVNNQKKTRGDGRKFREQIRGIGRTRTVFVYRIGLALRVAQERLTEDREWKAWLKKSSVKQSTAYDYIDFAKKAESEAAIRDMTLTQARIKLGLGTGRKPAKPAKMLESALGRIEAVVEVVRKGGVDDAGMKELAAIGSRIETVWDSLREIMTRAKDAKPEKTPKTASRKMATADVPG